MEAHLANIYSGVFEEIKSYINKFTYITNFWYLGWFKSVHTRFNITCFIKVDNINK